MSTVRPRRSVLYMPGANTRALEKARSLPADALIFDLEDAVAPDAKEAARTNVVLAAESKAYGKREIAIRCNGLTTPWGEADGAKISLHGSIWPGWISVLPSKPISTPCRQTVRKPSVSLMSL